MGKNKINASMDQVAETIVGILKTDRWVLLACDGDMGEGKSCFTSQLAQAVAKKLGTPFSYSKNMTYQREELKLWIDGDDSGKGQMPEYSVLLADELISMFFKRNWYDEGQIDGIELLNKCRDRHNFVMGNVPNFWDLDSAIYPLVTFWVHIHERGVAWLFQKDRNPFAVDKWHKKQNEKIFAKTRMPYTCKGFVCQVRFDDWSDREREEYYNVRNTKRVKTEGQRKLRGRAQKVQEQRNALIRWIVDNHPTMKQTELARIIPNMSTSTLSEVISPPVSDNSTV